MQWPADVTPTLNCAYADKWGLEDQHALGGAGMFVPADVTFATDGQANAAFSEDLALTINATHEQPYVTFNRQACDIYSDDDVASTVNARDHKAATDLVVPLLEAGCRTGPASATPKAGMGIGDPGDPMFTLQAGKQHAIAIQDVSGRDKAQNGRGWNDDGIAYTVDAAATQGISFIPDAADPLVAKEGCTWTHEGTTFRTRNVIAFSCKDSGGDAGEISPTLRGMSEVDGNANAGGQVAVFDPNQITNKDNRSSPTPGICHTLPGTATAPIAFKASHYTRDKDGAPSEIMPPLSADADKGDQDPLVLANVQPDLAASLGASPSSNGQSPNVGNGQGAVVSFDILNHRLGEQAHTLSSRNDMQAGAVLASAVRRLTPVECARLQGFPDDYLDIQFRGRPAADGNKYRALGNSMAVPCMAWIGRRIALVEALSRALEAA